MTAAYSKTHVEKNQNIVYGQWNCIMVGSATHVYVSKLTIIGSDDGLPPGRHQPIIQTNAWILLIGPFVTNHGEISIEIHAVKVNI